MQDDLSKSDGEITEALPATSIVPDPQTRPPQQEQEKHSGQTSPDSDIQDAGTAHIKRERQVYISLKPQPPKPAANKSCTSEPSRSSHPAETKTADVDLQAESLPSQTDTLKDPDSVNGIPIEESSEQNQPQEDSGINPEEQEYHEQNQKLITADGDQPVEGQCSANFEQIIHTEQTTQTQEVPGSFNHHNRLGKKSPKVVSATRLKKATSNETGLLQNIVISLGFDDYHKLTAKQRYEHLLWLLGFDKFPFRERGWAIIGLILVSGAIALFYSNPLKWNIYKNWRSQSFIQSATKALEENKLATAQLYLKNAFRHTPNNPELLRLWLKTLSPENYMERIATLSQIYSMRPDGEVAAEIAENMLSLRAYQEASNFIARKLTVHPDSARLWNTAGKLAIIQNRYEFAFEAFTKAKSLGQGQEAQAEFHLALLEVITKPVDAKMDLSHFEEFRKMPEFRQIASQTLAAIYLAKKDERATSFIESVISESPDLWDFRMLRFIIQLQNNPSDEENLWELIWKEAKNLEQRLSIIAHAIRVQRFEIAESLLMRLEQVDRDLPQARWIHLCLYIENKQFEDALNLVNQTQERMKLPENWDVQYQAARTLILERLGKREEARIAYNHAIRRIENNPSAMLAIGKNFMNMQIYEFARDAFQRASKSDSTVRETALSHLLELQRLDDNWDGVRDTVRRLYTANPSNNQFISMYASSLLVDGNFDNPLINVIIKSDFKTIKLNTNALLLIAHAMAARGLNGYAESVLEGQSITQEDDLWTRFHYASALAYLGRKEEVEYYAHGLLDSEKLTSKEKDYLRKLIARTTK